MEARRRRRLEVTKLFPNFSFQGDSWDNAKTNVANCICWRKGVDASPAPASLQRRVWRSGSAADSREKEEDVLSQGSRGQRTLAHQREGARGKNLSPPLPLSCAPAQALTPLTVSASFSLLLAKPEALFQPAAGRNAPGSQIAHKSINLSQSKHKEEPQGHSRKEREKALWFAACSLTGKSHLCPHPFGKFCIA